VALNGPGVEPAVAIGDYVTELVPIYELFAVCLAALVDGVKVRTAGALTIDLFPRDLGASS
jgi:hypothetical protein